MDRLGQDLRIALRGLRRTPAFTVAVVTILGLGIGMAVAMFTTFRTVLVRRLPVQDQDRVAVLWAYRVPTVEFSVPASDLPDILRASHALRDIAGVAHWGAPNTPFLDGDHSLTFRTAAVTSNFFDVLGAHAVQGRFLRPEDAVLGAPEVVVLSYGVWQSQFGGSLSVVGRRLIDPWFRHSVTIVGVAPPGLDYPAGAECWTPMAQDAKSQVYAVARLAPGASIDVAREEFSAAASRIEPGFKLTGADAQTFTTAVVGNARPTLIALTAAVALLLTIACVNVGTLFLIRAGSRASELAVRRALGASPGDLMRQLVVESAVLAAVGGAIGVVCAQVLLRALVALAPTQLPRLDEVRLHGNLLGAAIAVTSVAVLVFGVVPALVAARVDAAGRLQLGMRAGAETGRRRATRQWLVASQVAIALVMLVGAALLGKSLLSLEHLSLGYRAEHLSIGSVAFTAATYDSLDKITRLSEEVVRRIDAVPGVTAATSILLPPFIGLNVFRVPLEPEGQLSADSGDKMFMLVEAAGPDYFRTLGTPIIRGRGFMDTDREDAPPVVVVNESLARRFWPAADPIGRRLRVSQSGTARGDDPTSRTTQWRTVVGVVPDTRFRALRETWPMAYLPQRQFLGPAAAWQGRFAVRSVGNPTSVASGIGRAVREVDPTLAVYDLQPMDEALGTPLAQPRLIALLVTAFGTIALALAAIGLYGAMASVVRQQTHEIGVRMALGATAERVRREVLGAALRITVIGAAAGFVAALAGGRLLRALLFDVSTTDPIALSSACAVLLTVALGAAYVPARQATKIDPARALRAD
jgi:putative ABC transport system permease protein